MQNINKHIVVKQLNKYIIEKLKINKDSKVDNKFKYDVLNYKEFIGDLENKIDLLTIKDADEIFSKKVNNIITKVKTYDFIYIDPEKYKDNWEYKYYIENYKDILEDKYNTKKLYTDNIIHLSVYLHANVNLSNPEEGDEYYIFLVDNDKSYFIYQIIDNGEKLIKKL